MPAVMTTLSHHKPVIVFRKLQRGRHLPIGQRPASVQVIEVAGTFLQKDPNRFFSGFANQRMIIVTTSNVGKTAHVTENFAELVRPFPGNGPGTDSTTADPLKISIGGFV